MSGIQLTALDYLSSQGEDSPSEKQDGLVQIATDLTVIQFIKGKGALARIWGGRLEGHLRLYGIQPLPALLDLSFTPTAPS